MKNVLSVIMGGGRGLRLSPLTRDRAKPAVPLAGKYRLIDVPISNCLHSGLTKIYVLTQFNSNSLNRHIGRTYRFDMFFPGFVEILAAQQTPDDATWYQGTADAVRQNIRVFDHSEIDYVLVLSGDQLYRMDFSKLIGEHAGSDAEVTIAVKPVSREEAGRYGILTTDGTGRLVKFVEKPQEDSVLDALAIPEDCGGQHGIETGGRGYLASMGIYLFNKDVLFDLLTADTAKTDFGQEIIPDAIDHHHVHSFLFDGYWEDIGTIRAYYDASLAFLEESPTFDFYWNGRLLYTRARHLPATQVRNCTLSRTLLSEGCSVLADYIDHSIVGVRSLIGKGCEISDSIVMGADYYETDQKKAANSRRGIPNIGIGERCRIERAIIDKNARIGDDVTIKAFPDSFDRDGDHCVVRGGIVVVPRREVVPSGTVIAPDGMA